MIVGTHRIYKKEDCDQGFLDKLTVPNPVYYEYERMGITTKDIPRYLKLYEEGENSDLGKVILVPRNINFSPNKVTTKTKDLRVSGTPVNFKSNIKLREKQIDAVEALAKTRDGILVGPCGSGKTVMAVEALSRVGVTTLILVHKEFLMDQWAETIKNCLNEEVGIIRSSNWNWKGKKIVIGMLQTFHSQRGRIPQEFLEWPGLVISDETHRVSAPTWSQVIAMFPARRRWGLTASPERADGLELIFHAHIGDIVYQLEGQELQPKVYMVRTKCYVPHNAFINRWNGKPNRAKMINYLTNNRDRNVMILRLLIDATKAGRKILLLTERVDHAKFLKESFDLSMEGKGVSSMIYIGETTKEERLLARDVDVIFATSQMAKEGLDIPTLDTLFLVTPSSSVITIQQSTGRILRISPGKKDPLVVDFYDENTICVNSARRRKAIYDQLNYEVRVVEG